MDGIQKTVYDGLMYLAGRVAEGVYGRDDEAFQSEVESEAFLEDLTDEVENKIN